MESKYLYHGTHIDNAWLIYKSGKICNYYGSNELDGPSLTRNIAIAKEHAMSKTNDDLAYSFFDYFDLGNVPSGLNGVVFSFDRNKIKQPLVPYDDFGIGVGGSGYEEEERVIGELSLEPSLVGIYANKTDLESFLNLATSVVKQRGGSGYGEDFKNIILNMLNDKRLKVY